MTEQIGKVIGEDLLPVFPVTISFSQIDWAGRIFHSRVFEITQAVMEKFMATTPLGPIPKLFHSRQPLPVVVHAETDLLSPIELGDELRVQVGCERIGNTSFVMVYNLLKFASKRRASEMVLAARVKVVHVLVKGRGKKVKLPTRWRQVLEGILRNDTPQK